MTLTGRPLISASFLPTAFGFRTGLLSKVSGSSASRSDTASASLKKTMVPSTSIKQICEVSIIFSEALPNLFLLASVICSINTSIFLFRSWISPDSLSF